MHIPDGIVPAQICVAGYGLTGLLTWYSLRQIHKQGNSSSQIPKASLLTAAFFVASSIYIPIPPSSVHLLLNGLLGVVLGYFAPLAILVGLFFQALIVGHGGLTTLGINAAMLGVPSLLAYHIFQLRFFIPQWFSRKSPKSDLSDSQPANSTLPSTTATGIFAFLGGALGLALTAFIFMGIVISTLPASFDASTERRAVITLTLMHLPLALLEGSFTAMLAVFLQRVKPELLAEKR
ncbi:MAG: cobalt transporter CbiM [Cyanobacteria bacterium J06614_10]